MIRVHIHDSSYELRTITFTNFLRSHLQTFYDHSKKVSYQDLTVAANHFKRFPFSPSRSASSSRSRSEILRRSVDRNSNTKPASTNPTTGRRNGSTPGSRRRSRSRRSRSCNTCRGARFFPPEATNRIGKVGLGRNRTARSGRRRRGSRDFSAEILPTVPTCADFTKLFLSSLNLASRDTSKKH